MRRPTLSWAWAWRARRDAAFNAYINALAGAAGAVGRPVRITGVFGQSLWNLAVYAVLEKAAVKRATAGRTRNRTSTGWRRKY